MVKGAKRKEAKEDEGREIRRARMRKVGEKERKREREWRIRKGK